jgi:hypothetical protein
MAKQRIVLLVICLFISAALVGTQTQVGTATLADSIYILLDGTIMPSTAPIRQSGDTYQLTGKLLPAISWRKIISSLTAERLHVYRGKV